MFWSRRRKAPARPGPPSPARRDIGVQVAARLAATPGMRRVPVDGAQMVTHPGYLSPAQCRLLIDLIDAGRRKSTLLSTSNDPYFRTSDSCDLDRWSPDVQPIDEAIADLLGMEPRQGETIQGQRYAPGQQFRAHHDYFNENEPYWETMRPFGGQRTWTAMVYLNDVSDGGSTWFPRLGVRFKPERGLLVAWNNMGEDGSPNEATLHEGVAVTRGVKYIVTKWFREGSWIK